MKFARIEQRLRVSCTLALVVVVLGGCAPTAGLKPEPKPSIASSGRRQKSYLHPVTWPLTEPFKVTEKDLQHGELQLNHLLKARPKMRGIVPQGSQPWRWCVRRLAGAGTGHRIFWDTSPTQAGYAAEHRGEGYGETAAIFISEETTDAVTFQIRSQSGQEQWESLIFELNNSTHDDDFERVWNEAVKGKLTKEVFLRQNTELEFLALAETKLFYERIWLPWATGASLEMDTRADWGVASKVGYVRWIAAYDDLNTYPWDSWGKDFDERIVPYLRSIGRTPG